MNGKVLAAVAAALSLSAAGNVARAQEFQRLTYTPDQALPASGISAGVATMTLQMNEDTPEAENVLTWGRRGWGWGGARWGWGGWGGARWGWSGARWGGWGWAGPRWGWGGGWGWAGAPRWGWGGWGVNYWRPWVPTYSWGCYQPWVSYSVSPVYYYYPISTTVDVVSAPNYTQAIARVEPTRVYGQPNGGVVQSAPPTAPPQNGTYYYDGGPQNPVPLPKSNTAPPRPAPQLPPALPQQKTQPLEGIPVSLPATTQAKFAYPAYGEKPVQTNFAVDRVPTTTVKK